LERVGIVMEPKSIGVGTTHSVAFSPKGDLLITADYTGYIRIWDVTNKREHHGSPLAGHTGAVLSVAFNTDGTRLVSAGEDHTVRQWDMNDMRALGATMTGHSDVVKSVASARTGAPSRLRVWTGRCVCETQNRTHH
jgi:WD40 repeat protein